MWSQVLRLLEEPALIERELERRLQAARDAAPAKRQQDGLTRELAKIRKGMDRLLMAYQEDLLSLQELRRRMPTLRQREKGVEAELQALTTQLADQSTYLRLAQTLSAFLQRLRTNAETLNVEERQRITRLLVKEVVVGADSITIRHSIPTGGGHSPDGSGEEFGPGAAGAGRSRQGYLLRPWRALSVAGQHPVG